MSSSIKNSLIGWEWVTLCFVRNLWVVAFPLWRLRLYDESKAEI